MKKVISLSPTKSEFGPLLFSGDLELGLKKAEELGYDGVEISIRDPKDNRLLQSLTQFKPNGLHVYGIATGQSFYNDGLSLYSNDLETREMAIQRMKGHIDLAVDWGAMVIIGGIRGRLEGNENVTCQLSGGKEAIFEVARYGKDKGVVLLLEPINRYETNVINTISQAVELIDELGLDNLKILADTYHMNLEENSYEDAFKHAGRLLGYVHFADSNRLAPGWGHIDFSSIIETLTEIGFSGPIGIEVLPKPTDLAAAKQGIEFLNDLFLI